MRGLVWFKKDLRINNNPALYHAAKSCAEGVLAIYLIDIDMWKKNDTSDVQIEFILRGLIKLREDLAALGIPLLVEQASENTPAMLLKMATLHQVEKVFFNKEYEVNESRRDQAATLFLQTNRMNVEAFDDQLILPYAAIRTHQNDYFKVFTAFKNKWLSVLKNTESISVLPKPKVLKKLTIPVSPIPNSLPGIDSGIDAKLWVAGEKQANKLLTAFLDENIFSYDQQRDFPDLNATSHLSPYLALGMISVRSCFSAAVAANQGELDTGNKGALIWMSELIWRDFYRHILIAVPRVCMNKAYKIETETLPWSYDKKLLQAWQQGQTGYPIVDAAMRQLNQTGWMHNRLRMVAAMFLSKNLFLDWRLGERYFANKLIDFDFASNNGGWQWSASTGTDSVPYFRIFNPVRQSERFDSQGQFIKKYCPELLALEGASVHNPPEGYGYPQRIIHYESSRAKVINAFKGLK